MLVTRISGRELTCVTTKHVSRNFWQNQNNQTPNQKFRLGQYYGQNRKIARRPNFEELSCDFQVEYQKFVRQVQVHILEKLQAKNRESDMTKFGLRFFFN
jgi:lipocalin